MEASPSFLVAAVECGKRGNDVVFTRGRSVMGSAALTHPTKGAGGEIALVKPARAAFHRCATELLDNP
jgi:hypothetical protein